MLREASELFAVAVEVMKGEIGEVDEGSNEAMACLLLVPTVSEFGSEWAGRYPISIHLGRHSNCRHPFIHGSVTLFSRLPNRAVEPSLQL